MQPTMIVASKVSEEPATLLLLGLGAVNRKTNSAGLVWLGWFKFVTDLSYGVNEGRIVWVRFDFAS